MSAPIFELNNKKYYLKNMNMKKWKMENCIWKLILFIFQKGNICFLQLLILNGK